MITTELKKEVVGVGKGGKKIHYQTERSSVIKQPICGKRSREGQREKAKPATDTHTHTQKKTEF